MLEVVVAHQLQHLDELLQVGVLLGRDHVNHLTELVPLRVWKPWDPTGKCEC